MQINIRPYVPSLISGAALVLCFPYFDLSFLAWAALVPFLVSVSSMSKGRAFKAGFLMGLVYFFGTTYWIYHSMNHFGGVSLLPSLLIALLLAMYLSLYTGAFGALFSYKIVDSSTPAFLLAPVFWVLLEYARSYALTGFPWSLMGYTQYKALSVIQIADITGVYGVSFLVVAVNGALADVFISRRKRQEQPLFQLWPTYAGYGLLVVALAATLVYGHYRLNEERPGRTVKVSVVQGNISQDMKWDEENRSRILDIYRLLTVQAMRMHPSLVVWPESAAPFYWERDPAYTREILSFEDVIDTYLLFGVLTANEKDEPANTALLLDPNGRVVYSYDKIHLVPFGEYVPLREVLFFVDKLAVGIGDYKAGHEYKRGKTPFGEFGTLICYEIIFPGLVRKFFASGGEFLVTITNDAWFGKTPGPYQHFAFAPLRAVENRKPVVRAANTGISGFVDSNGRILSETSLFETKVLTEDMKTDGTLTLYTKYGDLFIYFCIVVAIVILMNIRRI